MVSYRIYDRPTYIVGYHQQKLKFTMNVKGNIVYADEEQNWPQDRTLGHT